MGEMLTRSRSFYHFAHSLRSSVSVTLMQQEPHAGGSALLSVQQPTQVNQSDFVAPHIRTHQLSSAPAGHSENADVADDATSVPMKCASDLLLLFMRKQLSP